MIHNKMYKRGPKAAPGSQSECYDGHRHVDEPCNFSCWGCRSLIWPYIDIIYTENFAQKIGTPKSMGIT